jgi:hypothetical protein
MNRGRGCPVALPVALATMQHNCCPAGVLGPASARTGMRSSHPHSLNRMKRLGHVSLAVWIKPCPIADERCARQGERTGGYRQTGGSLRTCGAIASEGADACPVALPLASSPTPNGTRSWARNVARSGWTR